jgi:NADPH2:quinone reductase
MLQVNSIIARGSVPLPLLPARDSILKPQSPSLAHYTRNRDERLDRAEDILGWVNDGILKVKIEKTYPLAEAAQAHVDLASRKTSGKLLLIP